ncbi:uncharacterized protein LOC6049281 [Culex quinquefasciatus]|uniref:uncharacterized protein LOC6049281 n=1 Tax=Culex quinquefasciatus TaxID=7176 RepID=UPI0018E3A818|nr:uncharacterized protein LOC6049281 [Culex quinquefasciatus]
MTPHLRLAPTICLLAALALTLTSSMHIPEDMEILEGYDLESAGTEINPEDDFYEQRSLLEPFYYRAIRDKRDAPPYQVLESPGLRSHFRQRMPDVELSRKRSRRSSGDGGEEEKGTVTEPPKPTEELPKPEQQRMNQRTVEAWVKTPYQVQKPTPSQQEEIDSEAEASMMSEGIKARAPRVNFITQRRPNEPETREDKDKVVPELYRKPLARLFYEYPAAPRVYDSFSAQSQSPMFPKIYNKYDEYHRDMMDRMHPPSPHRFDAYYQRRYDQADYDNYFPRYTFPSYYYYPDKRFDVPSYYRGDRNYLLSNDVMDVPNVPPPVYIPSRNRRIIYYATLPEIVRTPPNVDLRYRPYQNKFANRYDPNFPTKGPLGGAYKSSTVNPLSAGGNKDDKYVSSTPIKIVRDLGVQQDNPGQNNNNGGAGGGSNGNGAAGRRQYSVKMGGRPNGGYQDQGGHYEQDRSYYGRHL